MRAAQVRLGRTGPLVSRLIFGTEHIIDLSPGDGGRILADAYLEHGVNHWDTAIAYKSHPQVAAGLGLAGRTNIVVTSKTRARTATEASSDLDLILRELDTGYLDICFLHYVRTGCLPQHMDALGQLVREREAGRVRHLGISSHSPSVLAAAARIEELEIVCGTLNSDGSRIDDGDLQDMLGALEACYAAGKGVYVIKILGCGELADDVPAAIKFVLQYPFIHAYNIGMRNLGELRENLAVIEGL